jgi:hypothetical protein
MSLGVLPYMTDVESAFLNAYLDKAVYVSCPQGYERYDEDGVPMVAMVLKALYGMPQAPRCWHDEVAKRLLKHDFKRSEADPCVLTGVSRYYPGGRSSHFLPLKNTGYPV